MNSVLVQTYRNIEVIIVDDNDENSLFRKETEKIMEKYQNNKKIKYVKHKNNIGASLARNTGINVSKGVYISF
ncbi:MAG: glycosyltransferase [Bacilli bacterium]|nr:glycosyltransferase [Bacilli bacterium]MDD4808868.1 glycosyltransferase [Bacilli bacterium]